MFRSERLCRHTPEPQIFVETTLRIDVKIDPFRGRVCSLGKSMH
jgi:hypothetical protein